MSQPYKCVNAFPNKCISATEHQESSGWVLGGEQTPCLPLSSCREDGALGGRRGFCAMVNGKRAQSGGGCVIRKWMDRQGLLNRGGERVKRGVGELSGKKNQHKQGMEMRTWQARVRKWQGVWVGWIWMECMRETEDSGDKGLDAMLPALELMLRSLEAGQLCGPVSAGSAVVSVCWGCPWGAGALGKSFVERAGIL